MVKNVATELRYSSEEQLRIDSKKDAVCVYVVCVACERIYILSLSTSSLLSLQCSPPGDS